MTGPREGIDGISEDPFLYRPQPLYLHEKFAMIRESRNRTVRLSHAGGREEDVPQGGGFGNVAPADAKRSQNV